MKPFDFLWLFLGVLLTVGSALALAAPSSGTSVRVEIQTDAGTFVYPLDQTQTIEASGPLGKTLVRIETGRALGPEVWVTESACKNKVCLQMGKISAPGQWIACLPNHIFVRITGKPSASGGLDARTF